MCGNEGRFGFVQVTLSLGLSLINLFLLFGNILAHPFGFLLSLFCNILIPHHLLKLFVGKLLLLSEFRRLGGEVAPKLCNILLRLGQFVQTGIHVKLLILHLFATVVDTI